MLMSLKLVELQLTERSPCPCRRIPVQNKLLTQYFNTLRKKELTTFHTYMHSCLVHGCCNVLPKVQHALQSVPTTSLLLCR